MKQHQALSVKRIGTQRRTKVVHDTCIACLAVDEKAHLKTKQREEKENREEIKSVATSIVELRLAEGISE